MPQADFIIAPDFIILPLGNLHNGNRQTVSYTRNCFSFVFVYLIPEKHITPVIAKPDNKVSKNIKQGISID